MGGVSNSGGLIPAARRAKALELLRREGALSIQRLAEEVGMSTATARRDPDFLTASGYLERSQGGGLLSRRLRTTFEPTMDIAERVARPAKLAIGRHVAELIEDGQSVIFDSSSTVLAVAHALSKRDTPLTAVTNDLRIAMALCVLPKVQLIVPGGQVRSGSFTLVGSTADAVIRTIHADLALIGVHSLSNLRPSETSIEVAGTKRSLTHAAQRVLLLLDSSKFEQDAFCEICPIQQVHDVISDDGMAAEHRLGLEQMGVRVTLVQV